MKEKSKFFLYVKSMRPKDSSFYVITTLSSILFFSLFLGIPVSIFQAVQIISITYLFSLYSFCSNNFFDKEIDEMNPLKKKNNPYSSGDISKRENISINIFLLAAVFLLTYIWFPSHLPLIFIFVVNISLYSRYFKRMPVVDLFSHFIWVFSFFLFPALILGVPAHLIPLFIIPFVGISNLGALEWNQFPDLESDSKSGIRSTLIVFGGEVVKAISYLSVFLIIIFIIGFSIVFNNLLVLIILPLSGLTAFRVRKNNFLGGNYEKVFFGYIVLLILFSLVLLAGLF